MQPVLVTGFYILRNSMCPIKNLKLDFIILGSMFHIKRCLNVLLSVNDKIKMLLNSKARVSMIIKAHDVKQPFQVKRNNSLQFNWKVIVFM